MPVIGARVNGTRVQRRNMSFDSVAQCTEYINFMKSARDNIRLYIPRLAHSRLMFWIMARIIILEQCMTVAARRYSRVDQVSLKLFVKHMFELTETFQDNVREDAEILREELNIRGL